MEHWVLFVRMLFRNQLIVVVKYEGWNFARSCIYICSYGSRREGLLMCLSSVMVSLMLPYSSLQLRICKAYADCGSLFLIQRVCS